MRRLAVVLFVAVLLFGISVGAYGEDVKSAHGENAIIKFKARTAQDVPVVSHGYVKEIYSTTGPGPLEDYNHDAVKTFPLGTSDIHLVVRFHLDGFHSYTTFIMITNPGGYIDLLDSLSDAGNDVANDFGPYSPPASGGPYVVNALIIDNTNGDILVPTAGFPFVVE